MARKLTSNEERERNEKWQQLENAIKLRSAQDQVLWSIFGVFWAANAILLVALFPEGHCPTHYVGLIISLVGLFLAIVWYKIQNRALGHIYKYEGLMKELEELLEIPALYRVSGGITQKGIRARKLMPICSQVMMILWAVGVLFFLYSLIGETGRCPMSLNYLAFCGVAVAAIGGILIALASLNFERNRKFFKRGTFTGAILIFLGFALQAPYYNVLTLCEWITAFVAIVVIVAAYSIYQWFRSRKN